MATKEKAITEPLSVARLGDDELLSCFRLMVTSRAIDHREISLKRQNKTFFQISSAGHEAIGVAVARLTDPMKDWYFLYYRDRSFALALGQTPLEHLMQAAAAEDDPATGGRQMPGHFADPRFNMASSSSPTGTQFLQAVGAAEAGHIGASDPAIEARLSTFADDEIVVCCSGEGTTSEGEFWEAMNTACTLKLPLLFVVQDNEYAISVPVEVQTAGGSISKLLSGFPNLLIRECDGTSVEATYAAAADLVAHCRQRRGPALLHAHCTRPHSHSMSDDERAYRTHAELQEQASRDPLPKARRLLVERGIATEEELDALEAHVRDHVDAAADEALSRPQPRADTVLCHLYSEDVDPTGAEFEHSPRYEPGDTLYTMVDLLNLCLRDEMERDPSVVVFGQDVADASRREALEECKGKGGVFKVTRDLQRQFGGHRVFNAPIAEANIVGRAIGMAERGLRPVVEIQFFDYIWPAMQQLRNELATLRYRSAGAFSAPVVVRVTYGGYLKGGSIYHSQTGATLFTHTPGLRVVLPSTSEDANGLLRTAIRCDDPVLFLEHKHLYRQVYNKGRYPGPEHMIPFGRAKVVRQGTDLTVVTCGALVRKSLDAARSAETDHGLSVEVIDLRSLAPMDRETVGDSVRKTGRALVVHEDPLSFGIGAEVAARIADDHFSWLDAPVRRVASLDTWVAYAPSLEDATLPEVEDVLDAIVDLAAF